MDRCNECKKILSFELRMRRAKVSCFYRRTRTVSSTFSADEKWGGKKRERKRKGERERERDKPFLARQNFEPVIKCMRRRWIRLSTLGHRSCFRIFTHPLSDSSSGCFVATYTRSAALPLYTSSSSSSSSVSLAPLHPFRATRRFPYPGYVWNRVDRGNSLAWKFPRATSCCCSNWDVDTPKPTLHFPKLRLSISLSHRFIENPLASIPLGIRRLSFLLRKKENGE